MPVIFAACSQEPDLAGRVKRAKKKKKSCSHLLICIDPKYDQPQNEVFVSSTVPVYSAVHTMVLKRSC